MRTSGTIPPSLPTNADTASQSSNNNINTPEDPSSFPPEGFYILTGVVSEEAWEEIRVYLGLSTTGVTKSSSTGNPSIEIYGFCGNSNGDGHNNNNNNNNHNQDDCGSDAATIAMTRTVEIPWESTPFPQNRPVAQFGFRYDYERDVVVVPPENDDDNNKGGGEETVPKIPDVFHHLLLRPYHDDIITKSKSGNNSSSSSSNEFTQCIVNVYRPSTTMAVVNESKSSDPETTATITATTSCSSIPWHVDDPQFGPEIIVFTFGETRPLHMRLKNEDNSDENDNGNDASNETKHSRNDSFSYFTAHPSHRSCYVLSGPARHKWQHSVPSGSGWRVSITFRTLRTTQ
jgi:hypothetical protein